MYNYFKIRNFRCFKDLELNDLGLVNLITGMNNTGKTALLEAIFLHCGAYNPALILSINTLRGIETLDISPGQWIEHPLSSFFGEFDVSNPIELFGEDTLTGERTMRIKVPESKKLIFSSGYEDEPAIHYNMSDSDKVISSSEVAKILELEHKGQDNVWKCRMILDRNGIRLEPSPPSPPFQTFFQGANERINFSEQAKRYGYLETHNREEGILKTLKIIEPRLKRIRSVAVAGGSMLHGDLKIGHLVPLTVMGGGMVRLAEIAICIGNAPKGVVLVDEIENGLHHSVMYNVWKAIALAASQSNTQVFATTHSFECIWSAHAVFSDIGNYDFRLHRLDRIGDQIKLVTYDQESLDSAIKFELEVR